MRPSTEYSDADVYECTGCGARVSDPETRRCSECGGEIINLGKSRDL
jgi:rRNA maturation endonuclease Nob1